MHGSSEILISTGWGKCYLYIVECTEAGKKSRSNNCISPQKKRLGDGNAKNF
jgi:hypothetical protein